MKTPILNRNQIELPADGWHQIEVSGSHPAGQWGKQLIDGRARSAIVAAFKEEAGKPGFAGLLVDQDHLSHDIRNSTEAYAWLHEVEERDGELWGRLEWTDIGGQAVKNKRFKWFSTEYNPEDLENVDATTVRPLRLSGLALTNRPNNKGGRPISNRSETQDGKTQDTREKSPAPAGKPATNKTMKTIAEKLGLPAEATEEQILAAIGELQSEIDKSKAKQAESEVDEILNRHAKRVPEGQRDAWRAQLLANRATTETLLAGLPERQEKAAPDRIHNRGTATPPAGSAVSAQGEGDDAKRARQQAEHVASIRNRDKSTFQQAWDTARREKPELFA